MADFNRTELDDCWIKILEYLPLSYRLIFESVCKKWQNLMPYSDMKSFKLSQVKLPDWAIFKQTFYVQNGPFPCEIVEDEYIFHVLSQVCCRFGSVLMEIDLHKSRLNVRLSPELLQMLVQNAPNITNLILDSCIITIPCLSPLSDLQKLKKLSLTGAILVQKDLTSVVQNWSEVRNPLNSLIQAHPSLTHLSLISWILPPDFRANDSLVSLYLAGVPLSSQNLQNLIEQCPNLESLDLNSCKGGINFSFIGNLPSLQNLFLNNTSVNNGHLTSICMGCPVLRQVRLDWCIEIQNYDPLMELTHLELLWLGPYSMQTFTDANLMQLASYGKLVNLELTWSQITDEGVKYLAQTCPDLFNLSIAMTKVTDKGLGSVLRSCKQLNYLNCRYTNITDEILGIIGAEGHSLRNVNVRQCRNVTWNGFKLLIEERRERAKLNCELQPLVVMAEDVYKHVNLKTALDDLKQVKVEVEALFP